MCHIISALILCSPLVKRVAYKCTPILAPVWEAAGTGLIGPLNQGFVILMNKLKDWFKNRRTVARVRHVKNLKMFIGYIQLKTSSFQLSGYILQWIKNGKNDNYNKYKNRCNYKKNILKWEKNMYLSVIVC